jgi:murein DD-endopeptidase MepM/ murein hydrolase activator NlpD
MLSPTPVVTALVEPRVVSVASSATGRWQYPIDPVRVVRHFDAPDPDWLPGHRGVDLAAIAGAPIRSPALGVVSFAGVVVDRPVVTIDHGRIQTTYEPAEALVPVGRLVVAGEPFAQVDSGGHCEGCLHWGARISARYVNPLWLVQGYTPVLKTPR